MTQIPDVMSCGRFSILSGLMLKRLCVAFAVVVCLLRASICVADPLTVFAAASLKNAMEDVGDHYARETGHHPRFVFASSAVLARQIHYGAPAHLFVSANTQWMDWLVKQGSVSRHAQTNLLRNELVLIERGKSAVPVSTLTYEVFQQRLGPQGYLAMAMVDSVPAGQYGKAALQSLGLWAALSGRVAQTDNVRAALSLVSLGEASLGIVYQSDALADPGVSVIARFPDESHEPIIYPVASVQGNEHQQLRRFEAFLQSRGAQEVFVRHGFGIVAAVSSPTGAP